MGRIKQFLKRKGFGRLGRSIRTLSHGAVDYLGSIILFPVKLTVRKFNDKDVKRILIIRMDRIGDLVLSTPSFRAVRESFPDSRIGLLVNSYTRNLVINDPNIDEIFSYEKGSFNRIIKVIRTFEPDLAFVLTPAFLGNMLAFISGAAWRFGYDARGAGFFLTHKIRDDRETRVRHEVESTLEIVGLAGCVIKNKEIEVSITEEGEKFAEKYFRKNNMNLQDSIAVIHPGAREEYIRWKKEGFAAVADILIEKEKMKVIVLEGPGEKELVNEVCSLMNSKSIIASGLRLSELVSLVKRCSLFIGNSTGTMHIAAALKVPVVAIFGNIHPLDSYQEWGPWGDGNIVVSKNLNCVDCHPSDCKTFECRELVSVDDVMVAVEKLIRHT